MKEREPREHLYTKTVAICPDDLKWLKENKDRKSAAGKLSEIIGYYKTHNLNGIKK